MGTKMKGLLKGLRYISAMFENEKEEEMQIGLPTDVKHVAHIGWDGPSVSSPSWMNEFKSLPSNEEANITAAKSPSHGSKQTSANPEKPKVSRRHMLSPIEPPRRLHGIPKHSRRHHSSGATVDSPVRDLGGGSDRGRRHKISNIGIDSPSQESPSIPKHSRRRKSKGSNPIGEPTKGGGPRSPTEPSSDPKGGDGSQNSDMCSNSLPKVGE